MVIYPISFPKEPGAKVISVQLSAEGVFDKVIGFLWKIENGSYLVSIQNLTIESARSESEGENVRASILMDISVR